MYIHNKVFTDRIIYWNAARREPVFDYQLCINMLLEEIDEIIFSSSTVEELDAVGDIVFVAVGELWKLGFTKTNLSSIFYENDLTKMNIGELYSLALQVKEFSFDLFPVSKDPTAYQGVDLAVNSVFTIAIPKLMSIGYQKYFYDIVHAICDSNDTKDIVKVGSTVKSSKGPNFKTPLEALMNIIYELNIKPHMKTSNRFKARY